MDRLIVSLIAVLALSACDQSVLKQEPPGGTLPHNTTALVDDGTCPSDQIKKITGGNNDLGVPRKSQCIARQ